MDRRLEGKVAIVAGGATVEMDLRTEASVRDLVELTVSTYGGVDLLDNNAADTSMKAGVGDTDVVAIDLDLWDRIFSINLRGSGLTGEPDHVAYGCSKAGVIQLARHIAVRWGKEGIRCNAIAPGLIYTEKLAALGGAYADFAGLILQRVLTPELGRPEDIAATVAYLLSDDARYVTGQVLSVDGGMFVRGGSGRSDDPSSSEGVSGERRS